MSTLIKSKTALKIIQHNSLLWMHGWNWGTVSKINVWWKLEQIWRVSMGTETLFFNLFKINKNNKHWVTTIISYPANLMVALLTLTPLIWKVWSLHQMMMQLNPRQKEITGKPKMNVPILWHCSKFSLSYLVVVLFHMFLNVHCVFAIAHPLHSIHNTSALFCS